MAKKGGWYNESQRHSLAAKGISTGQKQQQRKDRAEWERRKKDVGGTTYYYNVPYGMDQYMKKDGEWYRSSLDEAGNAEWIKITPESSMYEHGIECLEQGIDPITRTTLVEKKTPTKSGLIEAEKKKGLIFYRKQSQKRRDRDLDLIREQKERAYKDKNTAALDRLNDKENIIIQVNMEKLDEE